MSASKKAAKKPVAKTKAKPAVAKKAATKASAPKPVAKVKKQTGAKAAGKPKAAAPASQKAAPAKAATNKKAVAKSKPETKKSAVKAATPTKAKPAPTKGKAAPSKDKKSGGKTATVQKHADKKAVPAKTKPAANTGAKAPKAAVAKAVVTQQPKSANKDNLARNQKPQPKATAHGTKSASAPKPAAPRPAAQTKPVAKKARPIFVKQSSSSKQDSNQPSAELDAKTKELVLSARKRTANGAAQKQGRTGKAAIAFTMDDVVQVLAKKQSESSSQPASEKTTTAVKVAKKQEIELEVPQEKRVHSAVSLSDILGFNPADKKGPSAATSKGREVPRKWSRYFKMLVDLREQVSNVLEQHTAETLKRSNRDDSGDLSGYGQHMADAGTDTFDRDFALSMVSSEQEALFEINEAIERIYNGSYGVCEITEETISAERLEAVPFTRYSLEGQKELEKTKRQKIQRGGVFSDNEDNISFDEDDN